MGGCSVYGVFGVYESLRSDWSIEPIWGHMGGCMCGVGSPRAI